MDTPKIKFKLGSKKFYDIYEPVAFEYYDMYKKGVVPSIPNLVAPGTRELYFTVEYDNYILHQAIKRAKTNLFKCLYIPQNLTDGYNNRILTGVTWGDIGEIEITNALRKISNYIMVISSEKLLAPYIIYATSTLGVKYTGFTNNTQGEVTPKLDITDYYTNILKTIRYSVPEVLDYTKGYECTFPGWDAAYSIPQDILNVKIWNKNKVLLRDYIPVAKDEIMGGKAAPSNCFYDKVSGNFFESVTSTEFQIVYREKEQFTNYAVTLPYIEDFVELP